MLQMSIGEDDHPAEGLDNSFAPYMILKIITHFIFHKFK